MIHTAHFGTLARGGHGVEGIGRIGKKIPGTDAPDIVHGSLEDEPLSLGSYLGKCRPKEPFPCFPFLSPMPFDVLSPLCSYDARIIHTLIFTQTPLSVVSGELATMEHQLFGLLLRVLPRVVYGRGPEGGDDVGGECVGGREPSDNESYFQATLCFFHHNPLTPPTLDVSYVVRRG